MAGRSLVGDSALDGDGAILTRLIRIYVPTAAARKKLADTLRFPRPSGAGQEDFCSGAAARPPDLREKPRLGPATVFNRCVALVEHDTGRPPPHRTNARILPIQTYITG
jgi:hypothetical protein